jgi:DNA-binding transcriptional LysR family regulator
LYMRFPQVSLDQWRVLQAIIDHGGYAQAAQALHRSQSSISYAISKMQEQLGVTVLQVKGRKAQLTEAGEVLLRRSRSLLQDAQALEELAHHLEQGWEAEVRLVVDAAFPTQILLQALKQFAPLDRGTRVLISEVVLSGARDALESGDADLVIGAEYAAGFLSDVLIEIEMVAVAHPDHPLHQLARSLTSRDLQSEMQVVIKDSGQNTPRDYGWLGAEHRWTVSSIDKAITTISSGLGYGWLPQHQILEQLQRRQLKLLPLKSGQRFRTHLYLTFGQEFPGEASKLLAKLLQDAVANW